MKNKIRFGIIGCSSIAENSTIPAIINSEFAEISMIGSRDLKKARKFASKFICKNFGTYNDVICDENVDAVYISTPIGLHEKWAKISAKAQKHILCEKSSTTSFSSAKKMVSETKKNNVKIMEALMFRFHPSHQQVQELTKLYIKKVFTFYSRYGFPPIQRKNIRYQKNIGGGVFNDAGCYPICASRIIFGKEPISVLANFSIDKKSRVDTKASIMLKYSDNEIANMEVGYDLEYQNFYNIWGKGGSLELSRAYNIPPKMNPIITLTKNIKVKNITIKPQDHFKLMIDAFCNYCTKDIKMSYNVEKDLLMQAKIMDAARKSNKEKRVITI